MFYKLEKPDISKIDLGKIYSNDSLIDSLFTPAGKTMYPVYLYWDKVKYQELPEGITPLEFWAFVKALRQNTTSSKESEVIAESRKPFKWMQLARTDHFQHIVDMDLGVNITQTRDVGIYRRRRSELKWIMEEAIASSQLEGAHTTVKAAKKMIRENRKPRNNSEHMIANNYKTMIKLEETFVDRKLDRSALLELHELLTENTMDAKEIGRFRNDKDEIVVKNDKEEIIHLPPKEEFLQVEINRLIDYANDDIHDKLFVHPVIKAIIIHFWVGYLHPFIDGNGRLARALFYWYTLRKGYWGFFHIPLSVIIKKSPIQYQMAYIYSEQDDNDLTYFIDYNMRKILQAKNIYDEELIKRKSINDLKIELTNKEFHFNDRQIQLLQYLIKNKNDFTTIKVHSNIYGINRVTAGKDLKDLQSMGFVVSKKIGREVHYFATEKINELFEK
jgi:Fic family protein